MEEFEIAVAEEYNFEGKFSETSNRSSFFIFWTVKTLLE